MLSFKPDLFSKNASKENPLSVLEMRIVAELHMVKDELLKELSLIVESASTGVANQGVISESLSLSIPEGLKRKPGGSRMHSHSSIDTTTTWSPAHPNEVMEGSYTSLLRQERADAQNVSHDPQTVGRYVVGFRHRWMNSTSGFSTIIQGRTFDALASVAVVMNAIAIGIEVHMKCAYGLDVPERLAIMEFYGDLFFLAIFSVEWLLRVMAAGLSFFSCTSDTCHWNWLDTLSLLSQVVDQVYNFVENSQVYFSSTMRLVRVMRIFRIVRLLHLSEKLGMLAHAIARPCPEVVFNDRLMRQTSNAASDYFAKSCSLFFRHWTLRRGNVSLLACDTFSTSAISHETGYTLTVQNRLGNVISLPGYGMPIGNYGRCFSST